jgi:hypothetical protein
MHIATTGSSLLARGYGICFLAAVMSFGVMACEPREEEPEYPPQPYPAYPQPYPQTYPQPYPQQQPYPQPAPAGTAPAPASSGTPTMLPGVTKNPDGTCSFTPPPPIGNAQNPQPMTVPCPPQ